MTRLHNGEHPRWLEWVPGLVTWGTFLALTILTFTAPLIVVNLMLLYALLWLARSLLMSARLIVGYIRYRRDIKRDWRTELETRFPADTVRGIYQLAIIAISKEDPSIVRSTIEAIKQSDYPLDRIVVVLACEQRFPHVVQAIKSLAKKYAPTFAAVEVTEHPPDIPGEVIGKGGNITWAARKIQRWLDRRRVPYENVICTTLDADNRVHRKYFAALTAAYLSHPEPMYATFQPIPMFFNNIWDVPMPIRSIALGSSFWQIIESTRPYRLRNFSSHAQGFAALVATEFWSVRSIVEDGHQFWRSYFRFNGKHDVVPLNVPVYQDAVLSPKGYWATFREQYLQKRRWAWGSSDIPYVLYHAWTNRNLPVFDKWLQAVRLLEGHHSWATTSVLLALYSWLPVLFGLNFGNEVLTHTFPPLYGRLLTTSIIGMAVTLTISLLLLPPRPKQRIKQSTWSVILEWVTAPLLLPISNIIFSSLPAIDAQTRLLFGKYLEFRVTEKHKVRRDISLHPAAK